MNWRDRDMGRRVTDPEKAVCRCGRATYTKPLDSWTLLPRCDGCGDSARLCPCPPVVRAPR